MLTVTESVQPQSKNGVSPIEQTNPEVLSQPDLPSKKATSGGNEKTRKAAIAETSNPAVLSKSSAISHPDTENTGFLEVDPNHARRKRRKTASPESKELPEGDEERTRVSSPISSPTAKPPNNVASEIEQVPEICTKSPPNVVAISTATSDEPGQGGDGGTASSSKDGSNVINTLPRAEQSKPKKILRFNPKTGTIGSPPSKKRSSLIEDASKPTQSRRGKQPKSRIVTIYYGHDRDLPPEVGLKIAQILQGNKVAASCAKNISILDYEQPKSMKVIGTNPAVPPHPFFLGKAAMKPPVVQKAVQSSPNVEIERPKESKTISLARTGSPKRSSSSKPTSSAFTGFAGFGNTAKILKFPGAIEPAWPWKGMTHIRGNDETLHTMHLPINGFSGLPSRTRKSKYQAVEVLANEDVIGLLATELCMGQIVKSIKDINIDEHPPLPSCLRTPVKRFEAGPKLQERVRKELVTPLPPANAAKDDSSSEDEIQGNISRRVRSHPALTKIYNAIATSLSAFDQSRCESQTWIHKYAPGAAAEVLQTGREAEILKEWLQKLTVMSVETSSGDGSNSRGSPVPRRPAGSKPDPSTKRKRKAKKLDGFVVSSDEEDNDMDEISEPEEDAFLSGSQGPLKRTVVRVGDASAKGSTRLTNAVVLSGPHGCGKTAAVYAVAKELGFEVFEINSSSRRSGKDILEKVGDMTRNHLVQISQNQAPTEAVDEDAKRISDALENDLKSGRQGTMNSFFKPRGSTKAISKPKKPDTTAKETKAGKSNVPPKAHPKQQKQSLILFEEVDVLYEEDKQFWATVMTMIIQSKRPIVMTCTDESSVPLSSLSLHAILRFTSPPIDLATDYMLLVAANEGHVIRRDAVKSLYESRHLDLRASLMELNFWCQFAVGDFRGGLDWFYSRWPSGSDVDEHGNTIRVVSEDTYQTGMGWLSQDFLESHLPYLDIEEETLHEAWDGWQLDVGDWQKTLDIPTWARKTQSLSKGKRDDLAALSIYADFSDEMSAADLCSSGAFASDSKVSLRLHSFMHSLITRRLRLMSTRQNYPPKPEKTIYFPMRSSKPLQ